MLQPDNRSLFLQALRPPEGYGFDCGVGTTYTLDLYTLLITPLSLALYDRQSPEQALSDPVGLLESLQRYSERLTIFCHAGNISLAKDAHPLTSFLEKMIVQVRPTQKGAFHPKVWLLRYISEGRPTLYRMLNLSRNLTFDRSWDLMLRLEGELTSRTNGIGRNRPLGDFIQVLPSLTIGEVNAAVVERVNLLQDEVRRVEFRAPPNFTGDFSFHPLGIQGYRTLKIDPFDQLLIVSPFLTADFLERTYQEKRKHILISRVESIKDLPQATYQKFQTTYHLDEKAEDVPREAPIVATEDREAVTEAESSSELHGLHAKLFVWDHSWEASWLIGSANATSAGFHKNVEFMVKLQGKRSVVGIDAILGKEDDRNSMRSLLRVYEPPVNPIAADPNQKKAEELTNEVCDWLIECALHLKVQKDEETYELILQAEKIPPKPRGTFAIECRPISKKEEFSKPYDPTIPGEEVRFHPLSIVQLTAFVGFEVHAQVGKAKHNNRFVIMLPISGLPEERDALILSAILSNQSQFLRYLRLILMDESEILATGGLIRRDSDSRTTGGGWEAMDMPLLEDLVHALSRSNQAGGKIERIADLVDRLQLCEEGRSIIPAEFNSLWQVILQARQAMHD